MSRAAMTGAVEALRGFFEGFGLKVWPEDGVPDGKKPPYITVQLALPDWTGNAAFYARVWYRSRTFDEVLATVDEIEAAIGAGAVAPFEGGTVWIYRDTPFAQFMPFPGDPELKCMYLRMQMAVIA